MATHRLPICHFTVLLILVAKHCCQMSTCFSTISSTFLPGRRTLSLVRAYPDDFQSVAMTRLDSSNLRPRLWDASTLSSHGPGNAIIQLSRLGIWCLWNSVAFMEVFFPSLSFCFTPGFCFVLGLSRRLSDVHASPCIGDHSPSAFRCLPPIYG